MKACAITMVYRDEWHLKNWVRYYGDLIGIDNLYVLSHGDEAEVRTHADGANVIGVPRSPSDNVATMKAELLTEHSKQLLASYDVVIVGDVDELLVPRDAGPDVLHFIEDLKDTECVHCIGVEVFSAGFDNSQDRASDKMVGRFSSVYTKAALMFQPTVLGSGHHGHVGSAFKMSTDIVSLHMKYANRDAFEKQFDILDELSQSDGYPHGGPWHDLRVNARRAGRTSRMGPRSYDAAEEEFLANVAPKHRKLDQEWRLSRFFPKTVFRLPDHMRVWE